MNYLAQHGTRETPQNEAIPGTNQVQNSAGGFAWAVDDWTRLHRFLILGSEGGSYYASERELTRENADTIMRCVKSDGPRTVSIICDISKEGRAPKNDPAIFALAVAASAGDDKTRRLALEALPEVCRIGTHLFNFATYVELFRGWGRGLRSAVARWYEDRESDQLAYQVVKYRQRNGWTHRDLLRLAHPKAQTPEKDAIYKYVTKRDESEAVRELTFGGLLPSAIVGFEKVQKAATPQETAELIREYGNALPRECLLTEHLNDPIVWEALLDAGMPMTALIRNLATMTRIGLLTPTGEYTTKVIEQIVNEDAIRKARVHPIAILAALKTYETGRSARGSGVWTPIPRIVDALDDAFYASFGNVPATGKRYLLALDVSGSMDMGEVSGIPGLTPRVASAAMAMVTMKTGDLYEVVGFTGGPGGGYYGRRSQGTDALQVLSFSPRQRLDDIVRATDSLPFGGTDCALPMIYATEKKREVDVFAVYTDSETWAGNIHPSQALVRYREKSGIDAKLIVVGMVSNGFSIADPNDAGMLDVVGFDTATPQLMQAFAEGGF